jgi:hypothetical protein
VAERYIRLMITGEDFLRLLRGHSATSSEHLRGIILGVHRASGKDIEAAKKPHLFGTARQENVETAAFIRPNEHNGGSKARTNHNYLIRKIRFTAK